MSGIELNINEPKFSENSEKQRQKKLQYSSIILVMGIISIVTCWCYGITGIVLGIISIVFSGKAKKIYNANPELYIIGSYKNMKVGRICSIIGLVLSSIFLVYVLIVFLFLGLALGTASGSMPWDILNYCF